MHNSYAYVLQHILYSKCKMLYLCPKAIHPRSLLFIMFDTSAFFRAQTTFQTHLSLGPRSCRFNFVVIKTIMPGSLFVNHPNQPTPGGGRPNDNGRRHSSTGQTSSRAFLADCFRAADDFQTRQTNQHGRCHKKSTSLSNHKH